MTNDEIDALSGRELDVAVAVAMDCPILGWAAVTWIDGGECINLEVETSDLYSLEPIIRRPFYTGVPVPEEDTYWVGSDGNEYTRKAQNLGGVPYMELMAVPFYHRELSDAMSPLLGLNSQEWHWGVYCDNAGIVRMFAKSRSESRTWNYASGPKDQICLVLCRAFLKLKARICNLDNKSKENR